MDEKGLRSVIMTIRVLAVVGIIFTVVFLSVPADIITRSLLGLVMSTAGSGGHGTVSITVSSGNVETALLGMIVLVTAAVFEKACTLSEENRFTI